MRSYIYYVRFLFAISNSLLVQSLKCYDGRNEDFKIVDSPYIKACVYETMIPCEFIQYPSDLNFRSATYIQDDESCFNKEHRAVCYCSTDLCNGDFQQLLKKWIDTSHTNATEYNCVKEHLEKMRSLDYTDIQIVTDAAEANTEDSDLVTAEEETSEDGDAMIYTATTTEEENLEYDDAMTYATTLSVLASDEGESIDGPMSALIEENNEVRTSKKKPKKKVIARKKKPATKEFFRTTNSKYKYGGRTRSSPDRNLIFDLPANFVVYGIVAVTVAVILLLVIPAFVISIITRASDRDTTDERLGKSPDSLMSTPRIADFTNKSGERANNGPREMFRVNERSKLPQKDANRRPVSTVTVRRMRGSRSINRRRCSVNRRPNMHISMATTSIPNRRRATVRRGVSSVERKTSSSW